MERPESLAPKVKTVGASNAAKGQLQELPPKPPQDDSERNVNLAVGTKPPIVLPKRRRRGLKKPEPEAVALDPVAYSLNWQRLLLRHLEQRPKLVKEFLSSEGQSCIIQTPQHPQQYQQQHPRPQQSQNNPHVPPAILDPLLKIAHLRYDANDVK